MLNDGLTLALNREVSIWYEWTLEIELISKMVTTRSHHFVAQSFPGQWFSSVKAFCTLHPFRTLWPCTTHIGNGHSKYIILSSAGLARAKRTLQLRRAQLLIFPPCSSSLFRSWRTALVNRALYYVPYPSSNNHPMC